MVIGLDERRPATVDDARRELERLQGEIGAARPTAVNLGWAVARVAKAAAAGGTVEEVRRLALEQALRIQAEDRESCRRIAEFGRIELARASRVMTCCNTGRLATSGIGTALGIVYAKAQSGEPVEVIATETRPLLQGSRLTAWELMDAGIPVTLVPDSATGPALASGRADVVIVGCDRVARSGATANKIGTYNLATVARANHVPFYVAGPMTSFDPNLEDGDRIPIEQRPAAEVRRVGTTVLAPEVQVWNPAFDVTPPELITAFITDVGVLKPPFAQSIGHAIEEAERLGLR
jgi:methylthioribose-1-phosphate isomerase